MFELQQQAADIVLADPAVAGVGSSIGTSACNASVNRGQLFISLKPLSERGETAWDVINRLRPQAQRHSRAAACSCSRRRTCAPAARQATPTTSTRSGAPTIRRCSRWAPRRRRPDAAACRSSSTSPPTASRAACRSTSSIDRVGGGAARRAHPGHRHRAQQRVRAAADLDDLHPAQPVPRHPRDRSAVPARPDRPRAHLRARRQRRAGAALRGHAGSSARLRRWWSITRASSRR